LCVTFPYALYIIFFIYFNTNYVINHTISPLCTKIDRAGLLKDYWQVHSRSLVDRKYRPRTFASHLDAIEFVSKWLPSYNEVARLYNVEREKEFKRLIKQELKTLKPLLSCSFDKALWYRCAVSIYGANVPMYFTE
jgi:hypothetical protein